MSRENRRRAQERPAATPTTPSKTSSVGGSSATTTGAGISWLHCAIGVVAGEALLLLLSNLGLRLADAAFGPSGTTDGGIVGVSTLLAVLIGGYIAARLAGRAGMYQGIVVAVGFIVIAAIFQFAGEASTVSDSLHSGSRNLVDLGPMNIGGLMTGDLLALFGGSVGGLLSGKR